jgi:hypothetical protein
MGYCVVERERESARERERKPARGRKLDVAAVYMIKYAPTHTHTHSCFYLGVGVYCLDKRRHRHPLGFIQSPVQTAADPRAVLTLFQIFGCCLVLDLLAVGAKLDVSG